MVGPMVWDNGQSSSISSRAEEKLLVGVDEAEVQNTWLSSSSSEAGVRQASRGVGSDRTKDGGEITGGVDTMESNPKAG